MRKTITALMLLTLALSVFGQGVLVLRFYVNRGFIAKTLCENRQRPQLKCDGQCILAKKLKAQEKQQEKSGIHFTEKFEVVWRDASVPELPEPYCVVVPCSWPALAVHKPSAGYRSLFRPPDCRA